MRTYDDIFSFICAYKTLHDGNSPTLRQIAKACHYGQSSIVNALNRLSDLGKLYINEDSKKIHVIGGRWILDQKMLDTQGKGSMLNGASEKNEAGPPGKWSLT
jgi:hypothetical protein